MRRYGVLVLIILIVLIIIPFVITAVHAKSVHDNSIKNPFSTVPEMTLRQSSPYLHKNIASQSLHSSIIIDQPMLTGKYALYPRDKPRSRTSIVAVDAQPQNLNYQSWILEVSTFSWNFVYPSPSNAYWICPIILSSTPIVVIKGEFPSCRYFSIVAYGGVDFTDSGESLFGAGIKKDGSAICNPSTPGDCSQLYDAQIVPDNGSKNPFADKSYKEGDPKFYTIYLVSPYYTGATPDWPNVIPLGAYGLETALIVLRIYAPFNPKSCDSNLYDSSIPFNRLGCKTNKRIAIPPTDGGAVYSQKDKTSVCKTGDSVCIQKCVDFEIGKNQDPDCVQYVGFNKYCVCENMDGRCARYLDEKLRKCSNNTADINSFCQQKPKQSIDYCIDKIPIDETDYVGPTTICKTDECRYVKEGKLQQCVAAKLFSNKDAKCAAFKDPSKVTDLCKQDFQDRSTCAYEFNKYLNECIGTKENRPLIPLYCKSKSEEMRPAYDPTYNFETDPLCCQPDVQHYTCANGYCIPSVNGEYTTSDCEGACTQPCTPAPTSGPIPPPPQPSPSPFFCKENFTTCETRNDPSKCNPMTQDYFDVNIYSGINAKDTITYAWGGWTDLPDVFVKYNYNNYFVRLNTPQFPVRSEENAVRLMKSVLTSYKSKRSQNPNNMYIEENALTENFVLPTNIPTVPPRPTKKPSPPITFPPTPQPRDSKCQTYVDPKTYLYIGAEFPSGIGKTRSIQPPGCNYYGDLADCKSGGKKNSGPAADKQFGIVDCQGKLCLSRWGLLNNQVEFHGMAIPAAIVPNSGDFVVFPNPEASYIGFPTRFNKDCVYIIWFDGPTSPNTPGFDRLTDSTSYQVRYWDIQHSLYQATVTNPRPTLSGLNDHQLIKIPVNYIDEQSGKRVKGTRIGLVLCSYDQYNYLKTYGLWNDKMNWLNWGKTKLPTFQSVSNIIFDLKTIVKEATAFLPELSTILDQLIVFLQNIFGNFSDSQPIIDFLMNFLAQLQTFIDQLLPEIGNLVIDIVSNVRDIVNVLLQDLSQGRMPEYGVVFCRQILPSAHFSNSIESYYKKNPDCLSKNIELPPSQPFQESKVTHPYCNPGNQDYCDEYGFDPCCLSRDLLKHMGNYYPRVEKVRMCDIENYGAMFFDKYLYYPLPYITDLEPIDSSRCCFEDTDCQNKQRVCPFSDPCLDALRKINNDITGMHLPEQYAQLQQLLDSIGKQWKEILLCKVTPDKLSDILNNTKQIINNAIMEIIKTGQGQGIVPQLQQIIDDISSAQMICNL